MAFHQISGVKVRTNYDYPPIPVRMFDWSAIDDDTYDGAEDSHCPIGHGATEQGAIDDLLEQIADAADTTPPAPVIPADTRRHPAGCPDADWCRGNRACYWKCNEAAE